LQVAEKRGQIHVEVTNLTIVGTSSVYFENLVCVQIFRTNKKKFMARESFYLLSLR